MRDEGYANLEAPALDVRSISCGYSPRKLTLHEVSFQVRQGEFVAIIGPNGAGKTTLFRAISGLLPLRSGSLRINNMDAKLLSHKERARQLAIVNQTVKGDMLTVEEYVLMGRLPYHSQLQLFETAEDFAIAEESMRMTGILAKRRRHMDRLSGGEQQLAAIARALTQKTGILLLDEPTSHLDISHQLRILDLVKSLNATRRLTVLLIIHDLNLAAEYSDHLIMLKGGRIFTEGSPASVLTADNIREVYEAEVLVRDNPASGRPCVLEKIRYIFIVELSTTLLYIYILSVEFSIMMMYIYNKTVKLSTMMMYIYNSIVELSTMKKYTIFGVKEAQEERKHVYLGIQTNFLEQKRWKLSNAGTFPDYTKTNVPLSWKVSETSPTSFRTLNAEMKAHSPSWIRLSGISVKK